jgi:hypothetical protein
MTMTETYLALALLVTVLAGNAYGDHEIYYCVETDKNGFFLMKNLRNIKELHYQQINLNLDFTGLPKR